MGLWQWLKAWYMRQRRALRDRQIQRALHALAADYETFPTLVPMRKRNGWILMTPNYRPIVASTREETIARFRRYNKPVPYT